MGKLDTEVTVKTYIEKIDKLLVNDLNPRKINKKAYESLKKSLKEFPEMKQLREIVVDENLTILGGHQRIYALKDLGYPEVLVKQVIGLTDKQKREFIIKDNTASGEWDTDIIANEWDLTELEKWGMPVFKLAGADNEQEKSSDGASNTPREVQCPHCGEEFEI